MEENKLSNNVRRTRRPRIQTASVPGEFEKVPIQFELKSLSRNKLKLKNKEENLTYSIKLNQELNKQNIKHEV